MHRILGPTVLFFCVLLTVPAFVRAEEKPGSLPPAGRINNLKVLSDKIDDVTTVENILRSFVRPGMSDEERRRRSGRPW